MVEQLLNWFPKAQWMKCKVQQISCAKRNLLQPSSKAWHTVHRKACSIHAWAGFPCLQIQQTLDCCVSIGAAFWEPACQAEIWAADGSNRGTAVYLSMCWSTMCSTNVLMFSFLMNSMSSSTPAWSLKMRMIILIIVKGFRAHDELGAHRTSLVSPEQPVLCIPDNLVAWTTTDHKRLFNFSDDVKLSDWTVHKFLCTECDSLSHKK